MEAERRRRRALVEKVARACGVQAERLTVLYAPTRASPARCRSSRAASRWRSTRRTSCNFRLIDIVDGMAPRRCRRRAPTFVEAMGRTNDAIIYGGRVQLCRRRRRRRRRGLPTRCRASPRVTTARRSPRSSGGSTAISMPSTRMLFSPAEVAVTALEKRREFPARPIDAADARPASFSWHRSHGACRVRPHSPSCSSGPGATGTPAVCSGRSGGGGSSRSSRRSRPAASRPRGRARLPGARRSPPDGVFVRTIAAGSFEQVTACLGVLHALARARRPRMERRPRHRALRRQVDDHLLLAARRAAGAARARAVEGSEARGDRLKGRGRPLVLKPLFGAQGRGLAPVREPATCPARGREGVYHLQDSCRRRRRGIRTCGSSSAPGEPSPPC